MTRSYVTRGGEVREVPVPGPTGKRRDGESYGASLTRRNRESLTRGVHPITGDRLFIGCGERCASCDHLRLQGGVAGRFYKCVLNVTGGPKTDVRVSWPACSRYVRGEGWPT